jgi:hypothetical protein
MELDFMERLTFRAINPGVLSSLADRVYSHEGRVVIALCEENVFQATLLAAELDGQLCIPGGNTLESYIAGSIDNLENIGGLTWDSIDIVSDDDLDSTEAHIYRVAAS